MKLKRWTVIRVMTHPKDGVPGAYWATEQWFLLKYNALDWSFKLGDETYKRRLANPILDLLHETGWIVVSRKKLEAIDKTYQKIK